jgi:predicted nucleotidyltransferase
VILRRIDSDTEKAVRRFLGLIADRYDIADAILFGSRARGTHDQDSDADLAVILRSYNQPEIEILRDMSDTAYDVLLETGIDISPLPLLMDEWKQPDTYTNPELLRNIAKEGVRIDA